jgi:hypothetical protein
MNAFKLAVWAGLSLAVSEVFQPNMLILTDIFSGTASMSEVLGRNWSMAELWRTTLYQSWSK